MNFDIDSLLTCSVENVREGGESYIRHVLRQSGPVRSGGTGYDTREERRRGRRVGVRFIVIISHVK